MALSGGGLFAFGLLALDRAVAAHSELWESYDPQFARDRVKFAKDCHWDVVVAGGSPGMCVNSQHLKGLQWNGHHFDHTLNLAIPLATTTDIYHAIEHTLTKPPALLVYAAAVTDLNDNRIDGCFRDPSGRASRE